MPIVLTHFIKKSVYVKHLGILFNIEPFYVKHQAISFNIETLYVNSFHSSKRLQINPLTYVEKLTLLYFLLCRTCN